MNDNIPKATHSGKLKIGDITIPCAVLEDGMRVLTQRGVYAAIGRSGGTGGLKTKNAHQLPRFLAPVNLRPFISKDLERASMPILFKPKGVGKSAYGYPAELLPKICQVYLEARDARALKPQQEHLGIRADSLIRGLAHIGIIAMVDEATGYQEVRDRLALQEILDKYLTDEWAKWTKTFPDEYYKELFRLRGMPYPPTSSKRPSFIGHWTNDVVYTRLAPGVLKELKVLNPRLSSGHRKRKFFQYLTQDWGTPALREHLMKVIFLMKGCTSWDDFKRRLNRAAPKYGDTIPLDYPEPEE
jgi:hypothetical protein